jgi:hypothetical protein
MVRLVSVALVVLLTGVTARASPWYVTWTGDAYPETEGWTRYSSDPPAERWLEDGKLWIDSRAAWGMSDEYGQLRPGEMTLVPGEIFTMHWRVRVDFVYGEASADAGVWVWTDDQRAAFFTMGMDAIHSEYESGNWASFEPGVFHDFTFASADMLTYALWIDGVLSLQGAFHESLFDMPGMGWGDVSTDRSLSEWDAVDAGVTPEPSGVLCILIALCVWRPLRRLGAR